jgi:hypothetical protein
MVWLIEAGRSRAERKIFYTAFTDCIFTPLPGCDTKLQLTRSDLRSKLHTTFTLNTWGGMMTHTLRMNQWLAASALLTLCLVPRTAIAMEVETGLKNLRCVNLQVDVEQDPAIQSRARVTEEDLHHKISSTLKSALPLLSISPQCGNRFRLQLVLHDISTGQRPAYNGLLISGIEREATVLETGDRQEVEVWSGGIQQFRGPLDGATVTASQALARSLDYFAEAYHLSGNP